MLWDPWLLGLFLLTGMYFSVRTGFFQIFGCLTWLRVTTGSLFRGKKGGGQGGLTQLQTMATALASTIGTGSVAGVATAIAWGGPGAVFWMWVSALLGMMTGCMEKLLSVRYRRRQGEEWQGGPMEYMERGLRLPRLAAWFALCLALAALSGGAMVQSNSIAAGLETAFGFEKWKVGLLTALLTGMVIWGGVGRIGRVCERLVPAMALLFLGCGVVVLICHASAVPVALGEILSEAFAPRSAVGGGLGYGMMTAMRYGIARGVFTNEAGLGSSALAHAQTPQEEPAVQGMWGIFEVFVSTMVVSTVTALVVLTTGVYDKTAILTAIRAGESPGEESGVPMVAAAFSTVFGDWGGIIVAVCLFLFAFSSLLGWSYYGERGFSYLLRGGRGKGGFRLLFLAAVCVGSVWELGAVWQAADLFNGLMALPNLIALLLLSPEAMRQWRWWIKKRAYDRTFH